MPRLDPGFLSKESNHESSGMARYRRHSPGECARSENKKLNDAIVRLTSSAICGTDLHMVRGTVAGMEPGTIMGHESVGIVEEVGSAVRHIQREGTRKR